MSIFNFNKKIGINNTNEIMTTLINKNIKLETKIEVPENYVGLVYFRDYYQFTIESGDYTLHKDTFYKIVQKNERKNRNSKKPKFDFNIHYITKSELELEFNFKKATNFKQKDNYTFKMKYKIQDALKFAKEILLTSYHTNSQRTLNLIYSWCKEFCDYIFKKRISEKNNLNDYAEKYFKRYGISITDIKIINNSVKQNNFFETDTIEPLINSQPATTQPQLNNSSSSNLLIQNSNDKANYCPRCQSKLMENAPYCLHCGHKIL